MKKILIITLFLSFTISWSQMQMKYGGVKFGSNIVEITNFDDESRVDFYAGIFGDFNFGGVQVYHLQPEIEYSRQGSKNIKLEFISIVLANKFYFLKDKLPLCVIFAPAFNFTIHEEFNKDIGVSFGTKESEGMQFSLSAGLGYDFPFGLTVEARYKKGMDDFNSSTATSQFFNEKRSSTAIQIGLAYRFSF